MTTIDLIAKFAAAALEDHELPTPAPSVAASSMRVRAQARFDVALPREMRKVA